MFLCYNVGTMGREKERYIMGNKYANKEHWSCQAYLDVMIRVRLTLSLKDYLKKRLKKLEQLEKKAQKLDNNRKRKSASIFIGNSHLDPQELKRLYACESGVYSGEEDIYVQHWAWKDLYPDAWEDYQECAKHEPGFLKKLWLIAVKVHLQYAYHMVKREAENGETPEK